MSETPDAISRERIAALDRLMASEVRRLDEVFGRFEDSVATRFVAGNEFRASLSDVQGQMATRRELEAFQVEYRSAHGNLIQAVADLRTSVAVGPKELAELAQQADRSYGRREGVGLSANVGYLLAVIAIAVFSVVAVFLTQNNNSSSPVVCSAAYHPAPCP